MLLSDYLGIGYELDENGIFDPVLDEDSHFFINLQRLKKTTVPEFMESYERIFEYFRKIINSKYFMVIKSYFQPKKPIKSAFMLYAVQSRKG